MPQEKRRDKNLNTHIDLSKRCKFLREKSMKEETLKEENLLRPKAGAGVPEPGLNRRPDSVA